MNAYEAARTSAVLFDLSSRTKIELRGKDRASFLHNFCTQDINGLAVGKGCEALVLNVQARVLAYIRVFARKESLWLDSEPAFGPKIVQHLDRYLITEQVELIHCTQEYIHLHVAGPKAPAVCGVALDADLQHADVSIAGVSCQVRRNDCLSVPGYTIVFPATHARAVHDELAKHGVVSGDLNTYEILRIEAGTPEYGKDIDETNLPQELGRDSRLLSFTKGCYLGQEPVVRIRDLGHVNRVLLGLKLEGNTVPAASAQVVREGKEVGKVTSAALSPNVGSVIALAYIRRGYQQPGTVVVVENQPAIVTALPFV